MTDTEAKQRHRWKIIAGLVAAVILGIAAWQFDLQQVLKDALDWIKGQGYVGMAIFVALYIIATVLFIPGTILTLGAGAAYGVVIGSMLVSLGATLGATAAFLVGRYMARDWVEDKTQEMPKFRAIDRAVEREGWKIVLLTRLSPAFPFIVQNYAYGLTKVHLPSYIWASWLGMIPGTVLYVYLGSIAGSLAAAGERDRSPLEWALYALGLLATIAVTVFITRISRRALAERGAVEESDQ